MSDDLWNRYFGSYVTPDEYVAAAQGTSLLRRIKADLWKLWLEHPTDALSIEEIDEIATKLVQYLEG